MKAKITARQKAKQDKIVQKAKAIAHQHVNDKVQFDASATRNVVIKHYDGEYRVPGPDGTEAQAYYTNDKDDATATARAMYSTPISITIRSVQGF